MKDLSEFDDVLAKDVTVDQVTSLEFEFENFSITRVEHHWEITFEDEEGEQGVIVQREDFVDGKFEFEIDSKQECLLLEDFDRIEKFVYDNSLIS